MPESEPKPKLIELVGPGAGQGWKAVLRNGKPAVVHEIPVPPAEATAAVPRLQRLYEHRHPALSPVLAWGTDQNGVWVAVEPNEGTPLGSILSRGPLAPPAAAAIGAAVLSGVAALHEAGIALGGVGATAVRVTPHRDITLAGRPPGVFSGGARRPQNGPPLPRRPPPGRPPARSLPSARLRRTTHPIGPCRPIPRCPRSRSPRPQSRLRPLHRRRPPHRRRLLPPSRPGRTRRHAPPLHRSRRRGRPTRPRHRRGLP